MPVTELVCAECGATATDEETPYCPDCGTEDPWAEQPKYEFDESDLPIVFSYEVYNDTYGLWDAFCEAYFGTRLKGSDIAGLPEAFPKLKYCVTTLWFRITESFDVDGPYRSREAARAGKEDQEGKL